MHLLRLIGIDMSDEASRTFGGGVRNYLGALGFIVPLVGFEELVRSYVSNQTLPRGASISLMVAGLPIYVAPWAWERIRRKQSPTKNNLEYLSERDPGLGLAIWRMAEESAWGRWYAAQFLVGAGHPIREKYLLDMGAGNALQAIRDGEIEVRGRLPGELDFRPIPATHWRSSGLSFVEDTRTLWKLVIFPAGGAQIAPDGTIAVAHNAEAAARTDELRKFDSLIVDAYQFEKRWPKAEVVADRKRREFLRQARKRRLDAAEIKRLSDPSFWHRLFLLAGFR